ncbi:MAG: type II toxin-antitoxin system prevent-host-death family antitoxin [Propionibacteriaceae bacterium]|jgi:prevent-host-death family protein|nr:type II toxin-antitoxin system prevent-host-death family antitoxin [Propionibacteriaceae bacterium]
MTLTVNIAEAKSQLSRLVDEALDGNSVVIARRGKPIVALTPVNPPVQRELGFFPGALPDSFFDPLPEEELKAWGL